MSISPEDKDLEYTQGIRKKIVTAITSDENYDRIVKDEDAIKILLTTLKDIDSVAINKLKIQSDNENADKLAASKNLVTELLSKFDPNTASHAQAKNHNKRSFDESDGSRTYVEGEMSVGISTTSYEEFKQGDHS